MVTRVAKRSRYTRMHFEDIAQLLRESKPSFTRHTYYHAYIDQWNKTVDNFIELFKLWNDDFSEDMFREWIES